eukprot:scaffold6276_cov138-Cylindrotheca_fusiformis.AAC.18
MSSLKECSGQKRQCESDMNPRSDIDFHHDKASFGQDQVQWPSFPNDSDHGEQSKENTSPVRAALMKSLPNTHPTQNSVTRQRYVVFTPSMNRTDSSMCTTSSEKTNRIFREVSLPEAKISPSSLYFRRNLEQDEFSEMEETSAESDLHAACRNMSTLDDILRARCILNGKKGPVINSASKKDSSGSTPMHLLSSNKTLSSAMYGRHEFDFESTGYLTFQHQSTFDSNEPDSSLPNHVVQFVVNDLLAAYPPAMMLKDKDGFLPFQSSLVDWVHSCHNNIRGTVKEITYPRSNRISQVWETTSSTLRGAVNLGSRRGGFESSNSARDLERGSISRRQVFSPANKDGAESMNEGHCKDRAFSTLVRLSPHACFTLRLLSAVTDQLDIYNSSKPVISPRSNGFQTELNIHSLQRARAELKQFRRAYGSVDIVSIIVQTDLMETILLIQDEDDREFALSQTIVRRVMSSKQSIGVWLTRMLQSRDKHVSERAVEYLKRISNQPSDQYHTTDRSKVASNQDHPACDPLVDEVSNLQDFIPSLLALGDRGMEEAATTSIVKGVLDRMISKPFAGIVVLCDVIFLMLMIVGFRSAVNTLISGNSLAVVLRWIYVANIGIFYFIIREIGKFFSLLSIAKRSRIYFLSFWNLIDFMATALALASSVSMRWNFPVDDRGLDELSMLRGLLAITTGFLWLRVLSLLKAINMQLATFVLAIIQITKDILWFCVILLILVVSFSQMFFTLMAPAACASENSDSMQCNQGDYLLRVYTVLLGDFGNFELERFQSGFSVFLLVMYSFLVTVVLLNVLIAIASDSYEKCLLRSQHLFGRARIMLVAELVSFQNLLKSTNQYEEEESIISLRVYSTWWTRSLLFRNWSRSSVLFFCISLFVMVAWTLAELLGYSRGESYGTILLSLSSVIVNLMLFVMILAFLSNGATRISDKVDTTDDQSTSAEGYLQRAMLRILGTSKSNVNGGFKKRSDINDWSGRVHYLQQEIARIAKEQTALSMEHAKSMEKLISLSEERIRTEINDLHEAFGYVTKRHFAETDVGKYSC